jgi:hypothetical protein
MEESPEVGQVVVTLISSVAYDFALAVEGVATASVESVGVGVDRVRCRRRGGRLGLRGRGDRNGRGGLRRNGSVRRVIGLPEQIQDRAIDRVGKHGIACLVGVDHVHEEARIGEPVRLEELSPGILVDHAREVAHGREQAVELLDPGVESGHVGREDAEEEDGGAGRGCLDGVDDPKDAGGRLQGRVALADVVDPDHQHGDLRLAGEVALLDPGGQVRRGVTVDAEVRRTERGEVLREDRGPGSRTGRRPPVVGDRVAEEDDRVLSLRGLGHIGVLFVVLQPGRIDRAGQRPGLQEHDRRSESVGWRHGGSLKGGWSAMRIGLDRRNPRKDPQD